MNLLRSVRVKNITNLAFVFVLAVSSLTAIGPFLFSKQAGAVAGTTYTSVAFNNAGLIADRQTPSGGYVAAGPNLTTSILGNAASSDGFRKTEGLKASISASDSIKADLSINADWAPNTVRAGLWADAASGTIAGNANPIIEWTNFDNNPRWRVFDTLGGTGWNDLTGVSTAAGTYNLEIAVNSFTDNYDFLVNGAVVKSVTAKGGANLYNRLSAAMFNAYNTGAADYSVEWSNFSIGTYKLNTPTNLAPADGAVTNDVNFSMTWDKVADATQYEYMAFSNLADANNLSNPIYTDNSSASNYDQTGAQVVRNNSNTPDGNYFWRVRANDTKGHVSEWSTTKKVTVDTDSPTAPSITEPSGWHVSVNEVKWTASTDATDVTYALYYGSHSNDVNTLIESGIQGTSFAHTFANGPHNIRVVATDAAGNSTSSQVVGFQVIGVPTVITPTNGQYLNQANSANSYLAKWTSVYGVGGVSGYEVEYGVKRNGVYEYTLKTVPGNTTQRNQIFTTNFQGDMTIRVRAIYVIPMGGTDRGEWGETVAYSRDTIVPTTPGTPVTAPNPTNATSSTWSWDPSTDSGSGVAGYEYSLVAQGSAPSNWQSVNVNTVVVQNPTDDGSYAFFVRAYDVAGNTGNVSNPGVIGIDRTGPAVTLDTAPLLPQDARPIFTGSVDQSADQLEVTVTNTVNSLPVTGVLTYAAGDSVWSFKATTALAAGTYSYRVNVFAQDTLGNSKEESLTYAFTIPTVNNGGGTTVEVPGTPVVEEPATPVSEVAVITPLITSASSVLGASTTPAANSNQDVKGTTNVAAATDSDANNGTFMGLAWYWWLLILAAIALIIGLITRMIRRGGEGTA